MEKKGKIQINPYLEPALVLAVLLILTAVTVTVSRMDLGPMRIWTALAIAATKATLVLFFFMHIKKGGMVIALAFTLTIVILAIFIGLTFFDIAYR